MANGSEKRAKRSVATEVISRECTIHLHKYIHGKYVVGFLEE